MSSRHQMGAIMQRWMGPLRVTTIALSFIGFIALAVECDFKG